MMAGAEEPATLSGFCQPMAIAMVHLEARQSRVGGSWSPGLSVVGLAMRGRMERFDHLTAATSSRVESSSRGVVDGSCPSHRVWVVGNMESKGRRGSQGKRVENREERNGFWRALEISETPPSLAT